MSNQRGCSQCGTCLNVCPVYALMRREEYSPKGKQLLLDENLSKEFSEEDALALADYCACCGRCANVCPRHLSVPKALNLVRERHRGWKQGFWKRWIDGRKVLWPLAGLASGAVPGSLLPAKLSLMKHAAGAMRNPSRMKPVLRAVKPESRLPWEGREAVLFEGCTAETLRSSWCKKAKALIAFSGAKLLKKADFGCCGGTFAHGGLLDEAKAKALRNIAAWRALGRPVVATLCASCYASLHAYPAELFEEEREARLWQESVVAVSRFLDGIGLEPVEGSEKRNFLYHAPCHWQGADPDFKLLSRAFKGRIQKGASLCCGFGGILQILNVELSRSLAKKCWDGLASDKDATVLSGCSGCLIQLRANAPEGRDVRHWLELVEISK